MSRIGKTKYRLLGNQERGTAQAPVPAQDPRVPQAQQHPSTQTNLSSRPVQLAMITPTSCLFLLPTHRGTAHLVPTKNAATPSFPFRATGLGRCQSTLADAAILHLGDPCCAMNTKSRLWLLPVVSLGTVNLRETTACDRVVTAAALRDLTSRLSHERLGSSSRCL